MIINVKRIIEESLREGETLQSVIKSLHELARKHMIRDFEGLKRRLRLNENMTYRQFIQVYKADEKLRCAFQDVKYDHVVGYLGEIAVHHALRHDWRAVYEFNDINKYGQPDGLVDNSTYDVKTRHKNREGLSVSASKVRCDFYILCHFVTGCVHIIGYAAREELLKARRISTSLCISPNELHSFDDFVAKFSSRSS